MTTKLNLLRKNSLFLSNYKEDEIFFKRKKIRKEVQLFEIEQKCHFNWYNYFIDTNKNNKFVTLFCNTSNKIRTFFDDKETINKTIWINILQKKIRKYLEFKKELIIKLLKKKKINYRYIKKILEYK